MKTGYTDAAGYCLVASGERNGRRRIPACRNPRLGAGDRSDPHRQHAGRVEHHAAHGLALSSGDTASVGVGGLTLGGGIGWMVRAWGLAVDQLVARVVRPSQIVGVGVALFLAQCETHGGAPG